MTNPQQHTEHQIPCACGRRHIWFLDALPLGPIGKILKREITLPADLSPTDQD